MSNAGGGIGGGFGNICGKAHKMDKALSKATCPNTINMLVTKKNRASSISSPSQRWTPNFVPWFMTQVPLFNANVSTIQRYNVGSKIGTAVFE